MNDCLFCKIIEGQIPSTKLYEDDDCLAFLDINPQAAKHIVLIPKMHVANVLECVELGTELPGKLICAAANIAKEQGLAEGGFRLVTNCGANAMQSVEHFHIHILGGSQLSGEMC